MMSAETGKGHQHGVLPMKGQGTGQGPHAQSTLNKISKCFTSVRTKSAVPSYRESFTFPPTSNQRGSQPVD